MKHLLLGDEAIAQGAIDAGLSGVYAYPGTPSTEITEFIQLAEAKQHRGIHCRWAANEKRFSVRRARRVWACRISWRPS